MAELTIPFDIPLTFPVLFAAVQIVLDLVLILIVIFLLKRISAFNPRKLDVLIDTLKESRRLCDQLARTVSENAEIAENIERLMTKSDSGSSDKPSVSFDAGSSRSQREYVIRLWRSGRSIEEIADEVGLGRGEVEVITSLAEQSGAAK